MIVQIYKTHEYQAVLDEIAAIGIGTTPHSRMVILSALLQCANGEISMAKRLKPTDEYIFSFIQNLIPNQPFLASRITQLILDAMGAK